MAASHKNKESSSTPLFIWILQVIVVLVFCSFVIHLCLIPRAPTYTITNLYTPNANGGGNVRDHVEINPNQNASTIVFYLVITNPNKAKSILYDETKITLYKDGSVLGQTSLPGFYQNGISNISYLVLVNITGQPKLHLASTKTENGTLEVGLETSLRYKILRWTTKKHLLTTEASVPVDKDGRILLGNEGLKLKPAWITS